MQKTVIIIGGGATGSGIAKFAAEAGFKVVLIEQGKMASGTTGHFHGMLHSGARYAVNDMRVAQACYQENIRLRETIPEVIKDTGGLFLAYDNTEAAHGDNLVKACAKAGIPIEEVSIASALEREKYLSKDLVRAFSVPDATIDGAALVELNKQAARCAKIPATFLTNTAVESFDQDATGRIPADVVINATGVWAGGITKLAGIELSMIYDKGTMIAMKNKFNSSVLNRCRPEADGDLLVEHDGYTVLGTTARRIESLEDNLPTQEEVDVLLTEGSRMVPVLENTTARYVYSGVRPLIKPEISTGNNVDSRTVSRGFKLINHSTDGVDNLISITGGKVTLYRLMSEAVTRVLIERYA